ncbi:hypothetical protein SEA_GRAVAILLIA_45 [Mycobacterium phage Gravaillia]|nr:hypothetical protein SEA_GRAVAILLIA_45 [Mycobacterium phage Gravaillia]
MTFTTGQPVALAGVEPPEFGVVVSAPAPGMRRVDWNDGTGADDRPVAELLEVMCAWFALCDQTAVALEPHPVLGAVPICERCRAKNERLAQ